MSLWLGRTQPEGNGLGNKTHSYSALISASHPLGGAGIWDPDGHRPDLGDKSLGVCVGGVVWRADHKLRVGHLKNLSEGVVSPAPRGFSKGFLNE